MSDEEPKIEVAGHLESGSDFVQARTVLSSEGIAPALTTTHPGIEQPKILEESEPRINIVGDFHLEKQGGGRNNHANDVMSPDGVSTCMTAAMGNGGGHVPKILEESDPGQGIAEPVMCPVKSMVKVRKNPGEPAFTVTTVDQHGVALMEKPDAEGIPMAEGERPIDVQKAKLRIRYLTPRECLRLMDFTDEQIDRLFVVEKSKSQLYKMAGNSIVVGVLAAIFRAIYIDETFKRPVKRVKLEDFL